MRTADASLQEAKSEHGLSNILLVTGSAQHQHSTFARFGGSLGISFHQGVLDTGWCIGTSAPCTHACAMRYESMLCEFGVAMNVIETLKVS